MNYLKICNFNIMSHSHSHFFFGDDSISETRQQYLNRYLTTFNIIETVINNYYPINILSLEEVTQESYEVLYPLISKYYHIYVTEITSPSGLGTLLVTGFNKTTFPEKTSILNLTSDLQIFYNVGASKSYPCRSQIFQINLLGKTIIYSHLHAPGIPDDRIKTRYFSKVKEFIFNLGKDKIHILCGDFNEERIEFLKTMFDNKLSILDDNRPTSYHKFTKNDNGLYTENDVKYKRVDHLLLNPNLLLESYHTIYNSNYGLVNHLSGVRGDGNVNPYYQYQNVWYPHVSNLGYIWPSDHTLNIYNIILPRAISKNNLQGGSSKDVKLNLLEIFEIYRKELNRFSDIYDMDEEIDVSDKDLSDLIELLKLIDSNILNRELQYNNLSDLKMALKNDSISEIITEYLYELDIFYSEPLYQKLYLNSKYDQLKVDIMTNCHQKIIENFGTENFTKDNIEIIKQFDSDNHGTEYPVLLLEIRRRKIVFKPRPALIDIAVLNLFIEINRVNPYPYSCFNLPEYKIVNCGNVSFWEYIEGGSVYDSGIISLLQTVDNLNKLRNLAMLNTVATRIGLTDLHTQNIIIRDDMYIPIDLEVIKQGSNTGLYMNESNVVIRGVMINLSSKIDNLISEFNDNVYNIPRRIVPISTIVLKDFIENNSVTIDELVYTFKQNIPNWDKQGISDSKLREYLMNCKQSGIIPYFIIQNGKIVMKHINN
jgi:hypothetical protein